MAGLDANDLLQWSDGEWLGELPSKPIKGFAYDTRLLEEGDLFVAFKTSQRDGHDFLADAQAKGAVGAIVQNKIEFSNSFPLLCVDDTLKAFQAIARGFRETWNFPVVAITGSCGKTTTKDLLCQLLGGYPVAQGTRGNLNNLIGVPSTLLGINPKECGYAVVEAGISERGEMKDLVDSINPDRVIFTAIGPSHLEGLGSVDGVAREKGLLASKPRTKRVYLGETCRPYGEYLNTEEGIWVSESETSADPLGWNYQVENVGSGMKLIFGNRDECYFLEGTGRGLASNAALAIAAARGFDVSPEKVQERLGKWKPSGMRGEWIEVGNSRVYLDCYNANPLSMLDSLHDFKTNADAAPNRLYVIGSMEELGSESEGWHKRLGSELTLGPGDKAYLIGEGSDWILEGFQVSKSSAGLVEKLESLESLERILAKFEGDVFLKGSRKYRLETVMEYLPETAVNERAPC
jgi:UDP-N-acetylmuramoyl-tripeptide--D-alanyl-D-alanine ligase